VITRGGPGSHQFAQTIERAERGAALLDHKLLSALATLMSPGGIFQTTAYEARQLLAVLHDFGGIPFFQKRDDVSEVAGIGPERHRGSVGRRFDHVLASPFSQASAHKGDLGRAPPASQLADRIHQQDAGKGTGCLALQFTAPLPGQSRSVQQLGHLVATGRMAGHQNQP
jgi:hypothetical protein